MKSLQISQGLQQLTASPGASKPYHLSASGPQALGKRGSIASHDHLQCGQAGRSGRVWSLHFLQRSFDPPPVASFLVLPGILQLKRLLCRFGARLVAVAFSQLPGDFLDLDAVHDMSSFVCSLNRASWSIAPDALTRIKDAGAPLSQRGQVFDRAQDLGKTAIEPEPDVDPQPPGGHARKQEGSFFELHS